MLKGYAYVNPLDFGLELLELLTKEPTTNLSQLATNFLLALLFIREEAKLNGGLNTRGKTTIFLIHASPSRYILV